MYLFVFRNKEHNTLCAQSLNMASFQSGALKFNADTVSFLAGCY